MQFFARHQLAEIDRVLRHDHPVFGQAARQHDMIGLTETAHITRMYRIMVARPAEVTGKLRRQAFVDEQPQAAFAQGRPPGLPTMGCVRA